MIQTRLEETWGAIKPRLIEKWGRLDSAQIDDIKGNYGKLVELFRDTYYPGRSVITVEAEIRGFINNELNEIFKEGGIL